MPHHGELLAWAAGMTAGVAPYAITPTGSPFTWTAPRAGRIYSSGGTITIIEAGRSGTFVSVGVLAGEIAVSAGDQVRITYVVAPAALTFFPS